MPNDVVRELYEELGELLEDGDDRFVEEGPALVQEYMQEDGFFDGLETDHAEPGEYTRAKVMGEDGEHVIRYMEWPPEYSLLPHEHHGRPCFEVLVDGGLAVADMEAEEVDDGFELETVDTYTVEPGEAGIVDPRENEIHAVYSPERSRSLHFYPEDKDEAIGYVLKDEADGDIYERRTFRLTDE